MKSILAVVCLNLIVCALGLRRVYPFYEVKSTNGDVGQPLLLTPYIEAGKIQEAQEAAQAKLEGTNVVSYTGFMTVNKTFNSNMFFWYVPSQFDPDNAPVILWLQGGPGATSLFGLFCEHGPFYLNQTSHLNNRKYSWSSVFNVIYIDNPVGTGFSFTDDERGYPENEEAVGNDLYSTLYQFFTMFPKLQKNDFFVTGESYGGKYVPAVSYAIHNFNKVRPLKINLKGLAMGNGWTAPEYMLNYGDYLYQIGLIDDNAKYMFSGAQNETLNYIKNGNYKLAHNVMNALMDGDDIPYKSYFYNVTGFDFYFNYLYNQEYSKFGDLGNYVQGDTVRKSIHVGNLPFLNGSKSADHLYDDVTMSVKPLIETLIENYRVLFYNGQLDIICSYPLTVNVLRNLVWSGSEDYLKAPRKKWIVDGELAGYSKTVKGMTELLVRDAGHMVPIDKPKWALDLITRFVFGKTF